MTFFLQIPTGIISNLLAMAIVYLTAKLVDNATMGNMELFRQKIPLILVLLLAQLLFQALRDRFCTDYKIKTGLNLQNKVYLARLNTMGGHSSKAEILNVYNEGIEQIKDYASKKAELFISIISITFAVIFMLKINAALLCVSVIFIPLCTYLSQKINKKFRLKSKIILDDKERINHDIKEILEGFYIIKSYLLESIFVHRFQTHCEQLKQDEKEKDRLNLVAGRISILLRYLPQLIVPLYGGWLCVNGKMMIGDLLAANFLIWYLISPIESFINLLKAKKMIEPVEEKVSRCLDKPGTPEKSPTPLPEMQSSAIEIKDLIFSYDNKSIFEHFNLQIQKGEHIALMGESGCGKSTLLKILCGLNTPFGGGIILGGEEFCSDCADKMRQKVCYLPQEPYLFSATIRENLCMGKSLSDKQLNCLLDLVGLKQEIDRLPQGLDTQIGDAGTHLSGGQQKRLAIARSIAVDAEVWLMDEPFSALNPEKSIELQKNLSEYFHGKTVIVVTHQHLPYWRSIKTIKLEREVLQVEGENKFLVTAVGEK